MKILLALCICFGCILIVFGSVVSQQQQIKISRTDTVRIKQKSPIKQIHKKKEQTRKLDEQEYKIPKMYEDRPLLIKEKDTVLIKKQ
jgi:hypothetical protein